MKRGKMSSSVLVTLILAGLLLGAGIAGATALKGKTASALSAPTVVEHASFEGESETEGTDDGAEGPEVPITGAALEQAGAAALEYIGEGRVTETEVGDQEGYYEVEITLDNGNQVDVHLDQAFNVLGREDG